MIHRHLIPHDEWSFAKIDDILDRGSMADWCVLLEAVEHDREIAEQVLSLAHATYRYGTSKLWIHTLETLYPEMVRQS